jgi:hypothetical protein
MPSVKTVMVGDKRFLLPYLDLIPFDPQQLDALRESVREVGAVLVPVVCWKEKKSSGEETVIDGAHRVLIASELGLAKVPVQWRPYDSEESAREDAERLNYDRRHLGTAELQERRAARIVRVAAARRPGQSTRAIAEAEGVSQSQVVADIRAATEQGCSVEPEGGRVTGLDGRGRPATAPTANGTAQAGQDTTGSTDQGCSVESGGGRPALVDAFGNLVPARCRNAYGDGWIQKSIDFLATISEQFRQQRLIDGMDRRARHYPYFDAKDFQDGCGFVIQYLDDLLGHLKANRPAGVCPTCAGKGCGSCRMAGMVPREVYKELGGKEVRE